LKTFSDFLKLILTLLSIVYEVTETDGQCTGQVRARQRALAVFIICCCFHWVLSFRPLDGDDRLSHRVKRGEPKFLNILFKKIFVSLLAEL
jgi:hypothetical protein